MGVPKFFRYISERYPCLSEFVRDYQIPIFDNLYLDMNGIIHMCSHPDDNNPHFRITEEKIFSDIFHYIEVLFSMIKPQKVFFMAVDGVAPRAKMNQQRGRRFRSAKEAEQLEKKALEKGEKLPEGQRFDSNCITPGTEFMARLHEQLKYFVVKKVSTDKLWKKCKVILSGQETPGEGEHKIMDYIRYTRSQPGYDPNTRHCLYGLDADLIMLGLCTHEPHFSLLREEVKFGKKAKRSNVPEEIRFYLLHLSLMREYLELEFASLKEKLKDQPKFDIEKIIDDWILMGFLVGNDFIPNLPNLHIANGALPILYQAYIDVLPTLDGYINEAGTLNMSRFEKFMEKLAEIDFKNFEEILEDIEYLESKTGRKSEVKDPALAALIANTDELDIASSDEEDTEHIAFKRHKDEYYRSKLEYSKVTPEVMREQAEGYVRAIQWNLNYYYNGVCSWSWFYPHHYSPYISDIKGFANLKIDFELGKPFKPYEQLLAVLPTASKNLLPQCYHHLMTEENSSIKSYYPTQFETDLNGKRQEWEAVVLVPFIDEKNLLEAMKPCNEELSSEEVERNRHGPMLVYQYTEEDLGIYQAPSYFHNVANHAKCEEKTIDDIRVPRDKLIKGAYPGARFDVYYPGFPTMKHLKYDCKLIAAKVKVFETPSRNENMIIKIIDDLYFEGSMPLDLLGSTVWVEWPHLVEAKVVALSDPRRKYIYCEGEEPRVEEQKLFDNELEGVTTRYRERMGIEFGQTKILVHVNLLTGRKYSFTSGRRVNLEKKYSNFVSTYPLQSIVKDIAVYDKDYSPYTDISDLFSVGSTCFSLTFPHYGSKGTIVDISDPTKLKVSLCVETEPDLSSVVRLHEDEKYNYMNLSNAAMQLAVTNYVFSRITGSIYISVRNGEGGFKSVNIGLDLKFTKKNQETPGYTRKVNTTWLYSQKAVELVKMYLEMFPEIAESLSNSSDDDFMADSVFKEDAEENVKKIQTWLKTIPTHNIERRSCGSDVLNPDIVQEIEKLTDQMDQSPKELTMQIKPFYLYKPDLQFGNLAPDQKASTRIFDRIVNVRDGVAVPLGLKGTVIAVRKSQTGDNTDEMFDVVFDKEFPGGMALNCSESRGYRLPKPSFINLTHGKRQMELKMGVPGQLRAQAKAHSANAQHFGKGRPSNHPSFGFVNNDGNLRNIRQENSAFVSFNKNMNQTVTSFAQNTQLTETKVQQRVQTVQKPKNAFYQMADFARPLDSRPNKENAKLPPSKKPQPKLEVDTELLKQMLKIPNDSNVRPKASTTQQNAGESIKNFTNATATLLTYYQTNRLGCPRYTYLVDDDKFCAQLVLPNGETISGKSAKDREAASENVARDALILLHKAPVQTLPQQFPVPPPNWVQNPKPQHKQFNAAKTHQMKSQDFGGSWRDEKRGFNNVQRGQTSFTNQQLYTPKDVRPQQDWRQDNASKNAPQSQNFVPLQALKKKQSTKPVSSANRTGNPSVNAKKEHKDVPKATAEMTRSKGNNSKKVDKSSQRKTRIAANFNK